MLINFIEYSSWNCVSLHLRENKNHPNANDYYFNRFFIFAVQRGIF